MPEKDAIKALAIGIEYTLQDAYWTSKESLLELTELAKTAGITVYNTITQSRKAPDYTSYFGKGKIAEIKVYCTENNITCLLIDDDITPAQSKFLEKDLNVKVIDRTALILDIFSQRAHTYEAQLQVEMAQLNYLLPRLTRLWTHLSRLGGGIGTRGPGEKQLEVDKRQITRRMSHIKRKLSKVKQDRQLRRQNRQELPLLSGAIVGYTNAGKSTLLNTLTAATVLAEDQLFATLDPTSRKYVLPNKTSLILTDTVGFIQKLPHHLVKAFYSTLEEVTEADFLVHVIDASHPNIEGMLDTSLSIIKRLQAAEKPHLFVFNKWDKVAKPNKLKAFIKAYTPHVCISLKDNSQLTHCIEAITDMLSEFNKEMSFFVPYDRMDVFNLLHKHGDVMHIEYNKDIEITVTINEIIGKKIMNNLYRKNY